MTARCVLALASLAFGPFAGGAAADSGRVVEWGSFSSYVAPSPPSVDGTEGMATAIVAGRDHACAIQADTEAVVCWGIDRCGEAMPPPSVDGTAGTATAISGVGHHNTCAIQGGTNAVVCWGCTGATTPPPSVDGTTGTALAIAAGDSHSCAIQGGTGAVVCWGDDDSGQATPPPAVDGGAGTATAIATGDQHACAIQTGTGAVVCWGDNSSGQATPPPSVDGSAGSATAIAAERSHTCAIQAGTGAVVCWGYNSSGQATPPASVNGEGGAAVAIATAELHSCAIQAGTSAVVCWGEDGFTYYTAPPSVNGSAGRAIAIAAGTFTVAGISGYSLAIQARECSDGLDADGDAEVDYPADPGCDSPTDVSEKSSTLVCDDGLDNDGDGAVDHPSDPGCLDVGDPSERGAAICDDGLDNDGDGRTDYPSDPSCGSPAAALERLETACDNGVDDDADDLADYPADPGCGFPGDDGEASVVFEVTTTADTDDGLCDADCSLREAIEAANAMPGADVVRLPAGVFALPPGGYPLFEAATLQGAGAKDTELRGYLEANPELPLTIENLSIRSGGIYFGAEGYPNAGSLRLESVSIEDSYLGLSLLGASSVSIRNSSIVRNEVGIRAGGCGFGCSRWRGTLTLENSTVSGNRQGVYLEAAGSGARVRIVSSTVANNGAGLSGLSETGALIEVDRVILASDESAPICNAAPIVSLGHNLATDGSCGLTHPTDLPDTDPMLGPLADNGGPTHTHALLSGSPALDAIPLEDCIQDDDGDPGTLEVPLVRDQRGAARPQGTGCDIGAYERGPAPTGEVVCTDAPLDWCIGAESARLEVGEGRPGRARLALALEGFDFATSQGELGDPVDGSTRIDVCVYRGAETLVTQLVVDRAGDLCAGEPCWEPIADRGYAYADQGRAASGVRKLRYESGRSGRGELRLLAANRDREGQNALPTAIAAALEGAGSARVQVLASDGGCFDAELTDVRRADGRRFVARGR